MVKKEFTAPHGRLRERHIQVLNRLAMGDDSPRAAQALGLAPRQVDNARRACYQRIGVQGCSALVHASYLLGIVRRPAYGGPLPSTGAAAVDADSIRVLELLASGAKSQEGARELGISERAWWYRVHFLKRATKAVSTHHLITRGWRHHALGPEHVSVLSGPPFTPACHPSSRGTL